MAGLWMLIVTIISIVTAVTAFSSGGFILALSGFVGPFLCFWGASGAKGMFYHGSILLGAILGGVFIGAGAGFVYYTGFWIRLLGYHLNGVTWCIIVAIISFILTNKEHAEVE
jgi:uncharacterized membrane-anchored protein YitT (DUF2179 family)